MCAFLLCTTLFESVKPFKNLRGKSAVKYSRLCGAFFTTVVKVSLVLMDHVWKSDWQCFSWTCRFIFMKELLYFLCLHCRPGVPVSREAVALSEGCVHQLWRGAHSSPDKGKDADLGTWPLSHLPAWWFHSSFLCNGRKTQINLLYSFWPQ